MRQFVATVIAVACCIGAVAQESERAGGIDIVFLIDDSRSMEANDPTDMRKVALKAFLDLTQEAGGDRIAVLRFAGWEPEGKSFLVYPLTRIPHDPNKRAETLKAIKEAIEKRITAGGMATDFNYAFSVALKEAIKPWLKTNRPLWIILFTDGQMAPGLLSLKQRLGKEFPAFYEPAEDKRVEGDLREGSRGHRQLRQSGLRSQRTQKETLRFEAQSGRPVWQTG